MQRKCPNRGQYRSFRRKRSSLWSWWRRMRRGPIRSISSFSGGQHSHNISTTIITFGMILMKKEKRIGATVPFHPIRRRLDARQKVCGGSAISRDPSTSSQWEPRSVQSGQFGQRMIVRPLCLHIHIFSSFGRTRTNKHTNANDSLNMRKWWSRKFYGVCAVGSGS